MAENIPAASLPLSAYPAASLPLSVYFAANSSPLASGQVAAAFSAAGLPVPPPIAAAAGSTQAAGGGAASLIANIAGQVTPDKALVLLSKGALDAAVNKIKPLRENKLSRLRLSKSIRLSVTLLTAALSSGVVASLQQHSNSIAVICSLGALVASLLAIFADHFAWDPGELGEVSAKIESATYLSGKFNLFLNDQAPMLDVRDSVDQSRQYVEYFHKMITKFET